MQLSCPEFPLRDLPRITVRGQTVQGGSVLLRKAPLRSSVLPWSTKRPCGPLAFRRATEGSRVLRRVWGCQEGAREPYGSLAPFCLRRETPATSPPGDPGNPPAVGTAFPSPPGDPGTSPANRTSGSGSTQIPRVFFNFPCLQLTFSIFHGILNYRKQKKSRCLGNISSLINGIRHLVCNHQRAVRSHHPETNNAPNGAYRLLV